MKFKDFVAAMQKAIDEDSKVGEMTVIYSSDDEGNSFHELHYDIPAIGIWGGGYGGEFCTHEDDLDERLKNGETLNAVCVN